VPHHAAGITPAHCIKPNGGAMNHIDRRSFGPQSSPSRVCLRVDGMGFDCEAIGILFPPPVFVVGEELDQAMNSIATRVDARKRGSGSLRRGPARVLPLAYAIILPATYPLNDARCCCVFIRAWPSNSAGAIRRTGSLGRRHSPWVVLPVDIAQGITLGGGSAWHSRR